MRALSALVVLVALGATGAVIAAGVTAPGHSGSAGDGPSRRGGADAGAIAAATAGHTSPAPPVRASRGPVRLVVRTRAGRVLARTRLGAVDPVRTAGGFAAIDPPDWNQAVWARYRPLVPPADTAHGTSYIYGHACHHHVCSFTRLHEVGVGGTVTVRAGDTATTYVITRASAGYPKHGEGSLADRRSGVANRAVPHRLVLVTCAYEQGDVSRNNFVVIAVRR